MMMTPQQIVLEYERTIGQSTSDRNREIKRLADVNECDKKEIVAILRRAGQLAPGPAGLRRRGRRDPQRAQG